MCAWKTILFQTIGKRKKTSQHRAGLSHASHLPFPPHTRGGTTVLKGKNTNKKDNHGPGSAELNIRLREGRNFVRSLIGGQPIRKAAKYNLSRSRQHNFLKGLWERGMPGNLAVLSAKAKPLK